MSKCVMPGCGRTLRTGRKYCYEHRYTRKVTLKKFWIGSKHYISINKNDFSALIVFLVVFSGILIYGLIKWFLIHPLTASIFYIIIITFIIARLFYRKNKNLKIIDYIFTVFLGFLFVYLSMKLKNPEHVIYIVYLIFFLAFIYIVIIINKNKDMIIKRQQERINGRKNKIKEFLSGFSFRHFENRNKLNNF